jgi:hypothetical protein
VTAPGGKGLRRVLSTLRATSRVTPGITRTTGFTCTRSRLGVSTTIKPTFTVTFAATLASGAAANEFPIVVAVSGQAANDASTVPFANAQLDPYPTSIFVPTPVFTPSQPSKLELDLRLVRTLAGRATGGSELHAAVELLLGEANEKRVLAGRSRSCWIRTLAWARVPVVFFSNVPTRRSSSPAGLYADCAA